MYIYTWLGFCTKCDELTIYFVVYLCALFPPRIPLYNKERQPCSAVKGLMISRVPQQQMLEALR